DEHRDKAVDRQLADPDSVLSAYRSFVHWRRTQPALIHGDIRFVDSPEGTIAFVRRLGRDAVLAVLNFSDAPVELPLPEAEPLHGHGFPEADFRDNVARISAHGAFFARL